ncbi:MAG TPA: c-type cytochrome biogenesis protein CcmI [Rhodopila sp.]|nr:c-type cytochrome biogenesis protein CcmI [Rhodopila sp.]
MILPFLLALLAFVALLPILSPLLSSARPVGERAQFDQAVYRDQLQELERDIERGLVTAAEAETARLEIQRRLLAASREQSRQSRLSRSPVMAAIILALVGGGSVLTYVYLGAPGLPDMPYASRPQAKNDMHDQARQAVEQLAAHLKQDPKDGQGWLLLARSLSALRDWDHAESAYRQAMSLGQDAADIQADHAEVLVMRAGGTVTPLAEAAFQKVLAADPDNAMARYYLALGRLQAGEPKKAIDGFQGLLALLPADSPLRTQIGQQIAGAAQAAGISMPELAKGTVDKSQGPSASQMAQAASMSPAQREAMVRGMVADLAAKQEADPANFDGWMRLGRAYAVLKDMDKAMAAYAKAQALRPDDLAVPEAEAQALLADYKPGEPLPERAVQLLHRIEAKDPHQVMAQWYLGLAAAQSGDTALARQHWQGLADRLPAGSEDRKMVEAALATLPGSGSANDAKTQGTPNGAANGTTRNGTTGPANATPGK